MGSGVSGLRAREVQPNEKYRMWSTFSRQSDGLVQRDPADNNVHCKGAFSDTTAVISTSDFNKNHLSLLFKDNENKKQYVMTAQTDQSIKAVDVDASSGSSYPDEAIFAAEYYWSYTIFRNQKYNQKYLGCDGNGNMTLVDMHSLDYPNPQALFILNKVPN